MAGTSPDFLEGRAIAAWAGGADRLLADYAEAQRILREALAEPPNDSESRALVLHGLGDLLREEGRSTEARSLFAEALRLPGISWRRQIDSIAGLADLDRDMHNWDASAEEWNRAIEIARERQATVMEAIALRGLGQSFQERGNLARAEPPLRRSLAILESDPSAGAPQLGSTFACLGELYLGEDKFALAEDALRRALDLEERGLGSGHPQIAVILQMLGDAVARRNQLDMARNYFERARQILTVQFGERSPTVGAVFASWGLMERRSGKPDRAADRFQKALEIFRSAGPDFEQLRLSVTQRYAEVLKATHHNGQAKALLAEVKSFGPPAP